jgi:DNA-binding MarR family transcriptional regulator
MTNNEKIRSLFKSLVKADLSKSEIAIINYLLAKKDKTITDLNTEMAKDLSMQQPNFARGLKNLKAKNCVGERHNGIYIKSNKSWGWNKVNSTQTEIES